MSGGEAARSSPAVSGARLPIGRQMDDVANAVGAVVVDQWRHDTTVGFAIACIFLECDVAATSIVISDEKDIILSYLSVNNMRILIRKVAKATIMKGARRIEIRARCIVGTTGASCS